MERWHTTCRRPSGAQENNCAWGEPLKSEGSGREGTRWRGRRRSIGTGFVAGRMSRISVGNEFQEGGGIHTSSLTSRQGLMGHALCAVPSGGDDCMVHRRAQVHNVFIPTQHALPVHPRPQIPETASEFQLSKESMFSLSLSFSPHY